jgi:hypothetical protein
MSTRKPSRNHLAGLAMALIMASACAASSFDGQIYHGEGFAFEIPKTASSWDRLTATDAALAYRDEAAQATVLINARCGMDGADVPLGALTQHLFLQFTAREVKKQEVVPFDGREAMHTRLDAKLDGVPMSYDVWVLKKDGCVYDLLYMAPPDNFDSGFPQFQALVQGFKTVTPNGK